VVTARALRRRRSVHSRARRRVAIPLALALVLIAISLLQAEGAVAQTKSAKRSNVTVMTCYERQLAVAVNNTRKQYKLRKLKLVSGLMRSAGKHSLQMAVRGYFAHNSANGASFYARVKSFYGGGSKFFSAGENMLWAEPSAAPGEVVERWLASPEHRRVLLSGHWTVFGVGVVRATHGPGVFRGRAVMLVTADFAVKR